MRSPNSGFTLVELIVALTVMVMITTVAFAGFRIGLNAWEKGTKAADRLERREAVERLIRRQLSVARSSEVFNGSPDRIEFVSDYSLADGPSDFLKVDYRIKGGQFLYGEKSLLQYVPTQPQELPSNVLATVGNASFEFLGEKKGKAAWVQEVQGAVPPAIRVRFDEDSLIIRMVNRK